MAEGDGGTGLFGPGVLDLRIDVDVVFVAAGDEEFGAVGVPGDAVVGVENGNRLLLNGLAVGGDVEDEDPLSGVGGVSGAGAGA